MLAKFFKRSKGVGFVYFVFEVPESGEAGESGEVHEEGKGATTEGVGKGATTEGVLGILPRLTDGAVPIKFLFDFFKFF